MLGLICSEENAFSFNDFRRLGDEMSDIIDIGVEYAPERIEMLLKRIFLVTRNERWIWHTG